jgi:hypothetical protein
MKLGWRGWLIGLAALAAASPFVAPEVLAFPYQQDFGADRVWSVEAIPRERMAAILAESRRLVADSPLAKGAEGRRIFLTDGGWRWAVLALQSRRGFGLTRPLREDVILNHSDIASGTLYNGTENGRVRTIAGVIAHEKCHGMERRQFGLLVDLTNPTWLVEGYCDYVARESSLSDAAAADLKARGIADVALPYFEGRRRVAAILATNGGNVDALFAGN